ncbi:hypothetical protein [Brevundimonas sp. Root1279]|uniref:hypothetical protein n=1 Tax=Brevundimonas sp. Root1279 TaxID=1736443 RepID=UPI0006F4C6D9|nr:hypothetical protein [Brevundimonas sp. Root1279]KQW86786.1 hypothetical protein ASC65_02575 [Brevundimonas sp. Root1279]
MFDDTDFRNGWQGDDDWEDDVIYGRNKPPAGAGGYNRRSDAVWEQARADYLSGYTAEAVCARYDLKIGTFKSRAAREEWRRSDQPDPEPRAWDEADAPESGDDAEDIAAAALPDYAAMARAALVRADRAIRGGRDLEAARWLRMHERLSRLITDYNWRLTAWREEEDAAKEAEAAPPEPAPAPDPLAAFAALSDQLTALEAALISDDSDDSDSVFSDAGSGAEPQAEGPRPPSD